MCYYVCTYTYLLLFFGPSPSVQGPTYQPIYFNRLALTVRPSKRPACSHAHQSPLASTYFHSKHVPSLLCLPNPLPLPCTGSLLLPITKSPSSPLHHSPLPCTGPFFFPHLSSLPSSTSPFPIFIQCALGEEG